MPYFKYYFCKSYKPLLQYVFALQLVSDFIISKSNNWHIDCTKPLKSQFRKAIKYTHNPHQRDDPYWLGVICDTEYELILHIKEYLKSEIIEISPNFIDNYIN